MTGVVQYRRRIPCVLRRSIAGDLAFSDSSRPIFVYPTHLPTAELSNPFLITYSNFSRDRIFGFVPLKSGFESHCVHA
jgi:hypothetical protein